MDRKYLTVTAAVLLVGCVPARVTSVNGPNGRPAYVLRCGLHTERCYERAGDLCPHGYDMFDQATGAAVVGTRNGLVGGTRTTLLVECR